MIIVCKKQEKIIENVETGVYTNGIRSTFIPQREKPKIPDRRSSKFLSKALNKMKVTASSTTKYGGRLYGNLYLLEWNDYEDVAEGEENDNLNDSAKDKKSTSKYGDSKSGSQLSKTKGDAKSKFLK